MHFYLFYFKPISSMMAEIFFQQMRITCRFLTVLKVYLHGFPCLMKAFYNLSANTNVYYFLQATINVFNILQIYVRDVISL